jgi:hypothetical protein
MHHESDLLHPALRSSRAANHDFLDFLVAIATRISSPWAFLAGRKSLDRASSLRQAALMAPQTLRRRYDHRFVDLVRESGDISIALKLGVPRSTAATWLRRPRKPVLTLERPLPTTDALGREVADLRRRVAALTVLIRVLFAVFRGFGLRLVGRRLPEARQQAPHR